MYEAKERRHCSLNEFLRVGIRFSLFLFYIIKFTRNYDVYDVVIVNTIESHLILSHSLSRVYVLADATLLYVVRLQLLFGNIFFFFLLIEYSRSFKHCKRRTQVLVKLL